MSFRDPGVYDFTVRRCERVFMTTLMRDDFSIRILIQSVVVKSVTVQRNDDAMHVVSDDQNGHENDQRRKHDVDTTKTPFAIAAATVKSLLFFYVVLLLLLLLLLLLVEAFVHLQLSSFPSVERRVAFPRDEETKSSVFRVAHKTLKNSDFFAIWILRRESG